MTNPVRLTVYLISAVVILSIIAWSFLVGVLYGRHQSNATSQNESANITRSNPSGLTLTGTITSISNDQLGINYEPTLINLTETLPAGNRIVTINDQTEIIVQMATTAEIGLRKQADLLASLAQKDSGKTTPPPVSASSTTTAADQIGSTSDLQIGKRIKIIIEETDGKAIAKRVTILK